MTNFHTILHVVSTSLLTILTIGMIVLLHERAKRKIMNPMAMKRHGKNTCEAEDPVSDPNYNLKEITKQCILLEEHLSIKSKYCSDCIRKHFLHCIGLAEEAVMLSCSSKDNSNIMAKNAVIILKNNFDEWRSNCHSYEDEKVRLEIVSSIRNFRKEMMNHYF